MRRDLVGLLFMVLTLHLAQAEDSPPNEQPVESKVVSVALFKNGLAVVKRQVPIGDAGVYRMTDVPEPVHGTFFVESNGAIEARVEQRLQMAQQAPLGFHVQDELVGMQVTLQLRSSKAPIVGTVLQVEMPELNSVSAPDVIHYSQLQVPTSRYLLLRTEKGTSYVDSNEIVSIEADGNPKPKKMADQKKPVLLLVCDQAPAGTLAQVSYLAHGLSWAPSYKVDLLDASRLTIEQFAVIRNELTDLDGTEISLISGYPSVQFGHVVSPLAATQSWSNFFQQLGSSGNANSPFGNSMVMQNAAYNRVPSSAGGSDFTVAPNIGDTIDLHYHSIGKKSLKRGDALSVATAKAVAEYERVVEWTIPDDRDEWGTLQNNRRMDPATGEPLQDDVWDALKFINRLPFPMTSAPAMVTTEAKFSGQSQVLWTNRGEQTTLRVNKALSIRARHVEYENQVEQEGVSERDIVYLGGRRFRKSTVNGELRLCNHRAADAKLIIKRQFSGDYLQGEASPRIDLREEGVWTINKRNELTWTITLKPSEEQTIKYQYSLLVPF